MMLMKAVMNILWPNYSDPDDLEYGLWMSLMLMMVVRRIVSSDSGGDGDGSRGDGDGAEADQAQSCGRWCGFSLSMLIWWCCQSVCSKLGVSSFPPGQRRLLQTRDDAKAASVWEDLGMSGPMHQLCSNLSSSGRTTGHTRTETRRRRGFNALDSESYAKPQAKQWSWRRPASLREGDLGANSAGPSERAQGFHLPQATELEGLSSGQVRIWGAKNDE